ncbi:hypothetical protein [Natronosalvus vescus]|uniref:hypothetical protein n=1 Tax=Natronosalvus vescus TaxID=2953881 RepID=UPI0020917286|nr:hypothetical protein [Natronosalvus vescus]
MNNYIYKVALIGSFLALTIGTLHVRWNPATQYELSIYSATPIWFWICATIALTCGTVVAVFSSNRLNRWVGFLLGPITMFVIVALPSIRGYEYYGSGDPMTYLGIAKEMREGLFMPMDTMYPAIMLHSLQFDYLLGYGLENSFMLLPAFYALVFFLFVPLTLRRLHNAWVLVMIGSMSALMILPVNQITQAGVFMRPYPTTAALFFLPLFLYMYVYLMESHRPRGFLLVTLCFLSLMTIHPQQAANVLILFGGVVMFHLATHYFRSTQQNVDFSLVSLTTAFAIVFWLWVAMRSRFERSISGLLLSLFVDTGTTGDVDRISGSLVAIGADISELFLRLFFVTLIYCIIVATIVTLQLARTIEIRVSPRENLIYNTVVVYLGIGLLPIGLLFFFYMTFSTQYFRHLGFMMAIATFIGSIGLYHLYTLSRNRLSVGHAKTALVIVLLGFLFLSIPVVHLSPFIFQANPHVSQGHMQGFDRTFTHADDDMEYTRVRVSPSRYSQAIYGHSARFSSNYSPDHFANQNLPGALTDDKYLPVPSIDRDRDAGLYNGFRFSYNDFEYIERESEINRVYSNHDYVLYYVHAADESDNAPRLD